MEYEWFEHREMCSYSKRVLSDKYMWHVITCSNISESSSFCTFPFHFALCWSDDTAKWYIFVRTEQNLKAHFLNNVVESERSAANTFIDE